VKGFPVAVWYWGTGAPDAGVQVLTDVGLVHAETGVAMVADLTSTAFTAAVPDGLTIARVTQADALCQYGTLLAGMFGDTGEQRAVAAYFQQLSAFPWQQFPALHHYIGIAGGDVIATGSLFVGGTTSGIYDIATRADARQRGIGSAMFAHLLREAKRYRHHYAVLQASADGMGIYQRAGFIPVGDVLVFDTRPLLQAST
jgi:GNAT superfamily N-acetyltransferase